MGMAERRCQANGHGAIPQRVLPDDLGRRSWWQARRGADVAIESGTESGDPVVAQNIAGASGAALPRNHAEEPDHHISRRVERDRPERDHRSGVAAD